VREAEERRKLMPCLPVQGAESWRAAMPNVWVPEVESRAIRRVPVRQAMARRKPMPSLPGQKVARSEFEI